MGKEIERRAQEGEDVAVLGEGGPTLYQRQRTAKTRAADATLIAKARRYGLRQLMRESGASQHATERFLSGERVHPRTRNKLEEGVRKLEKVGLGRIRPGQ